MKPLLCTRCHTIQDEDQFHRAKNKRGRNYWCKSCSSAYSATYTYGTKAPTCTECSGPGRISRSGICDRCLRKRGLRECSQCQEILALLLAFPKHSTRCKECSKKANKKAVKRYQRSRLDRVENSRLKCKYGITVQDVTRMRDQQRNSCAICSKQLLVAHIDHDHKTGVVRGLLCPSCNHGLGNFLDDPALLMRAIEYLQAFLPEKCSASPVEAMAGSATDQKALQELDQPPLGEDCEPREEG